MRIYIHGFRGNGNGGKSEIFREFYKKRGINFIAPSQTYIPSLAMNTLSELIESFLKYEKVELIGSSLGGFYAIYLSQKYDLKTVLINPSIEPYDTLARAIGHAGNFYDESYFSWEKSHLELLKKYDSEVKKPENFMLLAQKGDELLDYRVAVKKFADSKQIIENGGEHSFENIESKLEEIESFFK